MGVLVREVINFSSFWRSSTFSATVEPTIYLLAFGFGFGSLVSARVGGYDYIEFIGTGIGRHRRAVQQRVPGHVRDVREVQVPAHLRRDPRRAGGHRGARHRRGAVDRVRARAPTAARRCSWRCCSGWTRAGACCSCRSSPSSPASAGPASASASPARMNSIDNFSYVMSAVHHAAVPGRRHVLPDRRPAGVGAGRVRSSTRSTTSSSSSATPCSASRLVDLVEPRVPDRLRAADLADRRSAG